ncbi:electron transport complex subunit RsxC [Thioalkalivibrio sulfidiphilus]|uniref:electron transport complex subunit RsxC n=1 Tax=Thioalkalivibrio sulfidiphilus TaxID=1033854 RepID=UPI003BB1A624
MKRRLWSFPGGVRLPGFKELSNREAIVPFPVPRFIVLPLGQHAGQPAEPLVDVGERVLCGQLIARPAALVSAPVHTSTSGTVVAIEERPVAHRSGLPQRCIVIESDGLDEWIAPDDPQLDPWRTPAKELVERIRDAGIVGLGGAVFPSAVKLTPSKPVDTLIINGVECEPYITCDDLLMRSRPEAVLRGARLLLELTGARRCRVAVEDNKPEAARALEQALAEVLREDGAADMEVVQVPTRFPAGGEKQLIRVLTGREVPSGGLPFQVGVVCVNVGTVAAIHDALFQGRPLISRIVTVTGDGVAAPRNYEMRLGTPIREVLDHVLKSEARGSARVHIGGPMMGFELPDAHAPVAKGTNCLLVRAQPAETRPAEAMPCIRCGACADVCPVRLMPQQLYWHSRAGELDKTREHHLFDCIECGCCAHVCPSRIPLAQYYQFAKHEVREAERRARKAEMARARNEQRQARIERQKAEKEAKRRGRGRAKRDEGAEAGGDEAAA